MRRCALLFLLLILAFSTVTVAAQQIDNSCPGVVYSALDQLGTNCANMGRNSACYGFNNVDAVFSEPVAPNFFTLPDERADLNIVETIRTVALDLSQHLWGVSLLNVQANLPSALPGQGVVFVLLGGVEVENDVKPDQLVLPKDPVSVTLAQDLDFAVRPIPASGRPLTCSARRSPERSSRRMPSIRLAGGCVSSIMINPAGS